MLYDLGTIVVDSNYWYWICPVNMAAYKNTLCRPW